jgi:ribonuclease-3
MDAPELNREHIDQLVGTKVKDLGLYRRAFTHKSALKKYTLTESFETLEFIGDSVLGFIVTKMLFDQYEDRQEGFLTKARTKLVRGNTLATISYKLGLYNLVLMDDKGIRNGWNYNEKILEDVFEALVGAIYLDLGLLHVKKFILTIFSDPALIDLNCINHDDNYKDQLMRYCQSHFSCLPVYKYFQQNGIFYVSVIIKDLFIAVGEGQSKKAAEQDAAQESLKQLPNCVINASQSPGADQQGL